MTNPERPTIPAEELEQVPEEMREEVLQQMDEMFDELEQRGPVKLTFTDKNSGSGVYYDFHKQENVEFALQGEVEIGTYCDLDGAILRDPDPKLFEQCDLSIFPVVEVEAVNDEILHSMLKPGKLTDLYMEPFTRNEEGEIQDPNVKLLSDAAIAEIADHPEITAMTINGTEATAETIAKVVSSLPELRQFSLSSTVADFTDLSFFEGCKAETIQLSSPKLTGDVLATLPVLPDAVGVIFSGDNLLKNLDAKKFKESFPNVEYVDFRNFDRSEVDMKDTIALRAEYPGVEINGVNYSAKAVARLAKKHGIELA